MVEIMRFDSKNHAKRLVMLGLIVFFIIIFTSAIFAGFQAGNPSHSIEKIYGPEFNISGWINISFDEEPSDSFFNASFDGGSEVSIRLQELLDKELNYKESCICTLPNCEKDYSTIIGENSKTFTLDSGVSKILGLRISSIHPIGPFSSFSMKINSKADFFGVPQLTIDILDDNEIDWGAYKPYEEYQEINYGCFEEEKVETSATIGTMNYCQKISMPIFPQVIIGAFVQEIEGKGGNVNFTISIHDNLGRYKYCIQNASSSGQISCVISNLKTSQPQDFFVCIKTTNTEDKDKYEIKSEQNEPCGFAESSSIYTHDFKIFAQASFYDEIGEFILNNTEMYNSVDSYERIEDKILNYIENKYSGDCSNECVIPIKFTSGTNTHEITVSDISLSYQEAGVSISETTIYELTEAFPKISSDFQKLFIDKAGFSVPDELDDYDFSLKLNDKVVFSEDIEVKDVPIIQSLTPKATAAAFPTEFEIDVDSSNVSSYKWDFGDNTIGETTFINKVVHTYLTIGTYELQINVTDTRGLSSSKTFEINVTSPRDLIESTLNKMSANLQNLRTNIQDQELFHQTSLNSVLRIENISSEVERLKQQFSAATNDSEYMAMVGDLLEIRVPENVFKTKQARSFLFLPEKSSIDMDIVKSIGGGNYDSQRIENYKNAVMAWQQENIELEMDFTEFSGEYDSDIDSLVNIFEIRINEKQDIVYDYYLIIPTLQNIGFDRNVEEEGGFVYVNLKGVSGVNFYATEDVDFSDVPAFIAPSISRLVVSETTISPEESKKQKIIIFILCMISLIVMGIIAYVIIYQWYKRKYEKYLFKNRNDLYNIVTYVNNAKKKGLNNKKIIQNLKKAGWGSEQVRYIMRKYQGKRTGMVKLPLGRLINKVKKENSHQKHEKK